ncbi:hypothetical protein ACGC1H_001363 [Rhizoctonia solani]
MASSKHTYYSASTPSNPFLSSSSYAPTTRGSFSSQYHGSDAANTLEAFAEVNRALQSRNARQSLPRRMPQGPREPRAPNPETLPHQPVTMRKELLPQDASQLYPSYMHAHITQEHDIVNTRFSTASSPPVLYPRRLSFPSINDREIGRYEGYPRGTTSEGHVQPARPVLKLITPSSPQWAVVGSTAYTRDRTFQDMGYQSKSLKDRSSCIIM